jgi:catechol 2,3-dioxygenase-like lactoylglutathione lyase family enzyme
MQLDHATIVTRDLEGARRFLCGIVGLSDGPRPPFRVAGYWLYADGRPVIHLVEAALPALEGKACARIDHIALRVDNAAQWTSLVDRMHANGIRYELAEVPLASQLQLFVELAPGVIIEFVTALRHLTH